MAEKPKPDLEREDAGAKPASRPSPPPGRHSSPAPPERSSDAASPGELSGQSPEELATRAAEDLVTPEGLPSESSEPPDAIVLTGFLGASGRTGYRRLYLDATLKDYVEIPSEDVRHLEWVGAERSIFGRKATLWIRRGAALEYTTGES